MFGRLQKDGGAEPAFGMVIGLVMPFVTLHFGLCKKVELWRVW